MTLSEYITVVLQSIPETVSEVDIEAYVRPHSSTGDLLIDQNGGGHIRFTVPIKRLSNAEIKNIADTLLTRPS